MGLGAATQPDIITDRSLANNIMRITHENSDILAEDVTSLS